MVDFLEHIKNKEFLLTWEDVGDVSGVKTKWDNITNKYGIHELGFCLPDAVQFGFTIYTRKGFDFLCGFAESLGYEKPRLCTIRRRGKVIEPTELRYALKENDALQKRVEMLIRDLRKLTDIEIDDDNYEIRDWIDTTPFYRWHRDESFPMPYVIMERDKQRLETIWFHSNIMRDC